MRRDWTTQMTPTMASESSGVVGTKRPMSGLSRLRLRYGVAARWCGLGMAHEAGRPGLFSWVMFGVLEQVVELLTARRRQLKVEVGTRCRQCQVLRPGYAREERGVGAENDGVALSQICPSARRLRQKFTRSGRLCVPLVCSSDSGLAGLDKAASSLIASQVGNIVLFWSEARVVE